MIDKVHSSTTFIKYQTEQNINMDNPDVIEELRNKPIVIENKKEGKDLADIFYEFHIKAVNITDEECQKYNISKEDANKIVNIIKSFAQSFYQQKLNNTLLINKNDFSSRSNDL